MTILDKILADKKIEVAVAKQRLPLKVLKQKLKNFKRPQVMLNKSKDMRLIAEIKPKSPSAGVIRKKVDVKKLAKFFEAQGASAISVLTDNKYFGGSLEIFSQVRNATRLPLLRKEFII
ncbi:MAG TPA: indole-3-glycerol-phosphate synthase TrpC, partial [Candidatus Limnocylindria bacterium]|nr:indole-3-glycerol-phosphate synthase TrpC [Candidatus Limnocylindria bacterium]